MRCLAGFGLLASLLAAGLALAAACASDPLRDDIDSGAPFDSGVGADVPVPVDACPAPRDAAWTREASIDAVAPSCRRPSWVDVDGGSPHPCDFPEQGLCLPKTFVCVEGTCVPPGSQGTPCVPCETGEPGGSGWCQPGLACARDLCRTPLPSRADCSLTTDPRAPACSAGEECVPMIGATGRCTPYGEAAGLPCAAGGTCTGELTCDASSLLCVHLAHPGEPCLPDYRWKCAGDATCIADHADDPVVGTCRVRGTLGAECAPSGLRCAEGECFLVDGSSICAFQVPDGAACDPMKRTRICRGGSTCVPSEAGFACRPHGAAAGTPCLEAPALCAAPLTCVPESPMSKARCVRDVSGTCSPRTGSDRCPAPSVCAATTWTTGRCTVPTAEGDDAPSTPRGAPVLALPAVVAARGGAEDLEDCFAFDVPCGASVYAEANDGMGGDMGIPLLLLDPSGYSIASNDVWGAAKAIDGASPWSAAHALPDGRYTVCAMPPRTSYFLDISLD
jgi:hypothetical protein